MKRIKLKDVPNTQAGLNHYTYKDSAVLLCGAVLLWLVFMTPLRMSYYIFGLCAIIMIGVFVQVLHFVRYAHIRQNLEAAAEKQLNELFYCEPCNLVYRRYEVDRLEPVLRHVTHASNFKCHCKACGANIELLDEDSDIAHAVDYHDAIPLLTYEQALQYEQNKLNLVHFLGERTLKDLADTIKERRETLSRTLH